MGKEKTHYIYKITLLCGNLKNKYYLGKHTTSNINDGYTGSGKIVQDYFKKYGKKKNITYKKEIIEFNTTIEKNAEREKEIIGDLWETDNNCLNLCAGGETGGLSHEPWNKGITGCFSKNTIKKMSDAKKGKPSPFKGKHGRYTKETLAKIGAAAKGRKTSEETKIKIGLASTGHKLSQESRDKISKANKGRKHSISARKKMMVPIIQYSLDNEYIREWSGATEVENTIGLSHKQIWKCLNGEKKSFGGYIWKYKRVA